MCKFSFAPLALRFLGFNFCNVVVLFLAITCTCLLVYFVSFIIVCYAIVPMHVKTLHASLHGLYQGINVLLDTMPTVYHSQRFYVSLFFRMFVSHPPPCNHFP